VTSLVVLEDPENDTLAVSWSLDGEAVSNATGFNRSFVQGRYEVVLMVDDAHGNANPYRIVIVVTQRANPTVRPETFLYLAIILLIVAPVSVYAYRRWTRNRRDDPPPTVIGGPRS